MRLAIDFVAVADTQYQYGQESSQKPCSIGIAYLIGLLSGPDTRLLFEDGFTNRLR